MHTRHIALRLIFAVVPLLFLLHISPSIGRDFAPLYWGAQRVVEGATPYGPVATDDLASQWASDYRYGGLAYPYPLLLLFVPLTPLPFGLAALVWLLVGAALLLPAARLHPEWRRMALLPFFFFPAYRAVELGQATLLWTGLAVLLLGALLRPSRHSWWMVGLAVPLLLLKPQSGALIALAGVWWGATQERRALLLAALLALLLGTLSLLLQPTWFYDWLEQVRLYQHVVQSNTLLPWGALLLLACWRLPWWARLVVAQVVLFPVVADYSLLPLLLVWYCFNWRVAYVGAGVSWLWLVPEYLHRMPVSLYPSAVPGTTRSMLLMWLLVLLPLLLAAACASWGGRRCGGWRLNAEQ